MFDINNQKKMKKMFVQNKTQDQVSYTVKTDCPIFHFDQRVTVLHAYMFNSHQIFLQKELQYIRVSLTFIVLVQYKSSFRKYHTLCSSDRSRCLDLKQNRQHLALEDSRTNSSKVIQRAATRKKKAPPHPSPQPGPQRWTCMDGSSSITVG